MNTPNAFSAIDPARTVWFAADACLETRPASMRCGRCRKACPNATLIEDAPGLRAGADCLGCGRCAAVCPTGALALNDFTLAAPVEGRRIAVECRRVPAAAREPGATVLPCLGGLTLTELLGQAAGGTTVELIDRGWCADCPAGGGDRAPSEVVEAAQTFLDALGLPPSLAPRLTQGPLDRAFALPLLATQDAAAVSRRGFFGALLRRTVEAAAEAPAPAAVATRAACRPSPIARDRRRVWARVLDALARRAGRPLSAQFFPALEIGPQCTHHGVCASVCPSGALRGFAAEDGTVGLEFDAEQCLACGLCARRCPSGAVRVSPFGNRYAAHRPGPRGLTRHLQQTCTRCGKSFIAETFHSVCGPCRRQREMAAQLFGTAHADC